MKNILKRVFKVNRYFIVSYNAETEKGRVNGCCAFQNKNGTYPNRKEMEKHFNLQNLAPICITEVCEKDYLNYIKD